MHEATFALTAKVAFLGSLFSVNNHFISDVPYFTIIFNVTVFKADAL